MTVAAARLDLELRPGELHALLGEPGAGKSGLMRMVAGLDASDAEAIRLHGHPFAVRRPRDATAVGIAFVPQHPSLVPSLTVAENVVLGAEPRRGPLLARQAAVRAIAALAHDSGLAVDPRARASALSPVDRRRVEVLRALFRRPAILLLDETTVGLPPHEAEKLVALMRRLGAEGKSVVLATDKPGEAMQAADRITVLRDGRSVTSVPSGLTTEAELVGLMGGRPPARQASRDHRATERALLEVRSLLVRRRDGSPVLRSLDLEVHGGEVVAIWGVEGNGQSELVEVLTGRRRPAAGSVRLGGEELVGASPRRARAAGIGHVPQERERLGLVPAMSVAENLVLGDHGLPPVARWGWLQRQAIASRSVRLLSSFEVGVARPDTRVAEIAAGDRQRSVVARELDRTPALLVAAEPTRGLDAASAELVRGRLLAQREAGRGVLLVSADLDEVLALADRVLVLREGRIVLEGAAEAVTGADLAAAMAGRVRRAAPLVAP